MTRILLVSDRSLFAQGIEDLLRAEEGIDLVGRSARDESLQDCVQAQKPDVVVVDCADPAACPVQSLIGCLHSGGVQRVACVSPDENVVFLLSGERRAVTDIKDLVCAIAGEAPLARHTAPHGCPLPSTGLAKEAKPGRSQFADRTDDESVELKQIGGFNG